MKITLKYILFVLLTIHLGYAQTKSDAPKLVVGIVVDQMRYDYLERFSDDFTEGGFNRLLGQGFSCTKNYLNYVPTNTAPGHATIYTGTTPAQHGILNNAWYDRDSATPVYCVSDLSVQPVGTGDKSQKRSPIRLLTKTYTDHLKNADFNIGKVISIAIKDRAAILSGGKQADGVYWYRGKQQGAWISSDYYMKRLPKWVTEYNDSGRVSEYLKTWQLLHPEAVYNESLPDERSYERGYKGKDSATFPYDLLALAPDNGDFDILRATPFGNTFTFDFAIKALQNEKLGRDNRVDFLFISLSSTDYIGHNFGVNSKEVHDTYIRLDRQLESFLNELDATVGLGNYTLFLTSDHGASENSNYLKDSGKPGGFFPQAKFRIGLNDVYYKEYGISEMVLHISGNQIYLNQKLIHQNGLDNKEIEALAYNYSKEWPQIDTFIARSDLEQGMVKTDTELAILRGFNTMRSGDLFYSLQPSVVVYGPTGSTHGSDYLHDKHVPLIFFGNGVAPGHNMEQSSNEDIMATLAALLRMPPPEGITGNVIQKVLKN